MNELTLPTLNAEELRVLGSLMEKAKVTPEYYPMTINGLISACNQKTSRNPVVNFDESTVTVALDSLKKKGLVSTVVGGGSRVTKYKHNFAIVFPLVPAELAALCLLMLRGPLTAGEIKNMSGRLYDFESLDEVQRVLEQLEQSSPAYIVQLAKRPGQKEGRYMHVLGGPIDEANFEELYSPAVNSNSSELTQRVQKLEEELAKLRADFDELMRQLS